MKSNRTYKTPSEPSFLLYLLCMAAFALASLYFRQPVLAAVEGALTAVLAIAAVITRKKKRQQLTAYIESVTYDTENAKNSTLLSFPMPIAVFRFSDSGVVWGNDAFFSMFRLSGARTEAQLAVLFTPASQQVAAADYYAAQYVQPAAASQQTTAAEEGTSETQEAASGEAPAADAGEGAAGWGC